MLGGRLDAPALDLVAAAREAGALDDLADRLAKAAGLSGDDLFARSRLALVAATRAAQGRDADAATALRQLLSAAEKVPADAKPADPLAGPDRGASGRWTGRPWSGR
jgi:hypothetical protein